MFPLLFVSTAEAGLRRESARTTATLSKHAENHPDFETSSEQVVHGGGDPFRTRRIFSEAGAAIRCRQVPFPMRVKQVSWSRRMGEGVDREAFASTADLLGEPPGVDPVAKEQARARAEARLFGNASPPKIGRYEIAETLGGGGMGVVYSAYDPQLQRKVALKVLHPSHDHDERLHRRLMLEARTLARLDHPNIVKVHDAIVEGRNFVLIMELLEGETLERWQAKTLRSWDEITAAYAQAAEGLAAAHSVGVVHRDFKPSNAIVGHDGRVRVVDFGLARFSDSEAEPSTSRTGGHVELTVTGDVVGTLAFASPEQLSGKTATTASDQFSFCVALHAAVEGVAPFTGSSSLERRASIEKGELRRATDGRRVPPWLRILLGRGLAAHPSNRFAGMTDIVRELRRPRGWRRWRGAALAVGALAIAVTMTAKLSGTNEESCDGGMTAIREAWSTRQRERVRRAIGEIHTPYSVDVRDRVLREVDAYADEWSNAHQSVCRAHRQGETSAVLLDRQMTCLARRIGDLRAAVGVIARVDQASVSNVMDVVAAVPRASPCLDLEFVQSDAVPPSSLAVRVPINAARSQISEAEALARAGRPEEALEVLREARMIAASASYPPLQVDIALAEGRILLAQGNLTRAVEALEAARTAAFETNQLTAAVEASARLIYAQGSMAPKLDRLDGELATLIPLSKGLAGDHFVRPLLLNNIGTVYLAAGRRDDAASYFEQAKEEIRRHDAPELELVNIDLNLAMITADTPKREALALSAWKKFRDTLGDQHLSTLDALTAYAMYVVDPAEALEALSRAIGSYEKFHPSASNQIAMSLIRSGFLAAELGDPTLATRLYRRALDVADVTDPDVAQRRDVSRGELAVLVGDATSAIRILHPIYEASRSSSNWWQRADALRAEVGLGQAAAMSGNNTDAVRYLDDAVRALPAIVAMNEEVEFKRYLARARHLLAQVLLRMQRDPTRAASLEYEALRFYQSARYPAAVRNAATSPITIEGP